MRNRRYGSTKDFLLATLLAGLTAACSATLPSTQITITSASAVPPADYRKIISSGIPATIAKQAQVSELQKTEGAQLGDWVACLKSDNKPNDGLFAVFIENGKIVDFRRSVITDHCESAIYSPLAPAAPPVKKQSMHPERKQEHPISKTY
jgi:hypothetical protein